MEEDLESTRKTVNQQSEVIRSLEATCTSLRAMLDKATLQVRCPRSRVMVCSAFLSACDFRLAWNVSGEVAVKGDDVFPSGMVGLHSES